MIHLENVSKTFGTGVSALSDVTLHIEKGEFVFLVGPSGAGKTTLFRLLIREMLPTMGTIRVSDLEVTKLPHGKISHLRKKIGVIFQDLKLLSDRTIYENIILPLEMGSYDKKESQTRVDQLLSLVGLSDHKHKFPIQLSGGELQRVAIARALTFSPDILLADEPTGNLDAANSWEIVKILQDINKTGTTIVMATHNNDIINSLMKRVIGLEKGKLVKDDKKTDTVEKESSVSHTPTQEVKSEPLVQQQAEQMDKKE
jgi:cell division transport system ATP-binding protein